MKVGKSEIPTWLAILIIAIVIAIVGYFFWTKTTPHPRKPPPGVKPTPIAPGAMQKSH